MQAKSRRIERPPAPVGGRPWTTGLDDVPTEADDWTHQLLDEHHSMLEADEWPPHFGAAQHGIP